MRAFFALALLFLFASFAAAGSAGMNVPAVAVNGGGEIVWLSIEVRNGTGLVYTSTMPLVGLDTQASERTAVSVGMRAAGAEIGAHDALIRMDAGETKQVDGPSAGAAMALLTIAALNGSRVRGDITITGAIREDGKIASVGGIAEKAGASAQAGIRYLLIPRETQVSDRIIIMGIEEKHGIRLVEIDGILAAAAIAFSPEGSEISAPPQPKPEPVRGISNYSYECESCGIEKFALIAIETVKRNEETVTALASQSPAIRAGILPLLEKGAADARIALDRGYYYTAANTAFLNEVDAGMAGNPGVTRADAERKLVSAEACVAELARPALTVENMEFVFGGDLRAAWARGRAGETRKKIATMNDSDYEAVLSAYRDALYAEGWCGVASGLYSSGSEIGGVPADETALAGYANSAVREAEAAYAASGMGDSDTSWHLSMARELLNGSRYGGAVFDASYVMGTVRTANSSAEEVNSSEVASRKGETLWSALFLAQASFYSQAEPGAVGSIARLGFIADELERNSVAMRGILEDPDSAPDFPHEWQDGKSEAEKFNSSLVLLITLLCGLLVASAILNIVMMTMMRGRRRDEGNAFVKRDKRVRRK